MSEKKKTILVVDDDIGHRTMIKAHLGSEGYDLLEAEDGDIAVHLVGERPVDLVLLDLKMRRVGGLQALEEIRARRPFLPVLILTAFSSVESAVQAMKKGAFDYIPKPVDLLELSRTVERILQADRPPESGPSSPRGQREADMEFGDIIGSSRPMREVFETLALVAPTDATVLITGESGTGKERVADAVHRNSLRREGPFVKVNCAALHENLLESELFGHEKGAFTGAAEQRRGRFELAHGGTLFLDEIGDLSPATQAKILRVLQEGEFERVGGTRTLQVDVRVIAATHKDLPRMVEDGTFRQDLFFRLSVVPLHLPPLRERPEDIPSLAEHFLRKYSGKNRKNIHAFHPEAIAALMTHPWPGNIRELENAVERAVILCLTEQVSLAELPAPLRQSSSQQAHAAPRAGITLKDMEKEMIVATLRRTEGNRTRAAEILGITRQTLQNKLREYGLNI